MQRKTTMLDKAAAIKRNMLMYLLTLLPFVPMNANPNKDYPIKQSSLENLSSTRAQVCLNGLWDFCPATDLDNYPAKEKFGSVWVPGSWYSTNPWWTMVAGIHSKGEGNLWKNDLAQVHRAWYLKEISIPNTWQNSKILLDFEAISTDAIVFLNETSVDTVNWPGGTVDITNFVEPGKSYNLQLLVIAVAEEGHTFNLMGTANAMVTRVENTLQTRGITGEVFLKKQPVETYISDVFVQTSFRNKEIAIDVEVSDCPAYGEGSLSVAIRDQNREVVKLFSSKITVKDKGLNHFRLKSEWKNPELWDLDKPVLYDASVKVQLGENFDEYIQDFGFREFWIDGKDFYLNGIKINLKPNGLSFLGGMTEIIDTGIVNMRKCGYNFMEIWPQRFSERGMVNYNKQFIDRASKKGLLIAAPLLNATRYIMDENWQYIWDNDSMSEAYEKNMLPELKKLRNEPSVVMWVINPNFFGHEDDQNPLLIGMEGWIKEDIGWLKKFNSGIESCGIIKKHDPTRPVMNHHGTYTSDVHSLNHYLCLLPLQEREEWLSHYQNFGTMPFMSIEFGTPLENTFLRARAHFGESIKSEPLFTEHAASYFGKWAYQSETDEYRQQIKDFFIEDQEYENWQGNLINQRLPSHQALQNLFVTNTWRSWRTYEISGGMNPWMDAHGWAPNEDGGKISESYEFGEKRVGTYIEKLSLSKKHYLSPKYWIEYPGGTALRENNNTTLAYIGGKENEFTEKDHSFYAGTEFQKQAILISDYREPVAYNWKCTVMLNKKVIDTYAGEGNIEPAGIKKIPLKIHLPEKISTRKEEGLIVLEAQIGERTHSDTFKFRTFYRPDPLEIEIAIFDPVGKTKTMLKTLGTQVEDWNGNMEVKQLVIGREVLSSGYTLPADLKKYVASGGSLLVMAQQPKWMEKNMGLRMSKYVSRYVFPVKANHPVMNGLDELDLRNWNSSGTLVEAYPDYQNQTVQEGQYGTPYYGWHWSNNGSVTCAAIEKPHKSSWRPILECEFDLAYTPLMEMEYGKGKIMINMLDLEDNFDKDPAARLLTTNIIKYLQAPLRVAKANNVTCIGNQASKMLMNELGLRCSKATKIPENGDLVIIEDVSLVNENELKAFLKKGNQAICLYQNKPAGLFGVEYMLQDEFNGSLDFSDWKELEGLSSSDTRLRASTEWWVLSKGCEITGNGLFGRKEIGKGSILFCQVNPNTLPADSLTYFRYSRWRQTRALSQLLANAGCTFIADEGMFNYDDRVETVTLEGRWNAKLTRPKPVTISVISTIEDSGLSIEAQRLVKPFADVSHLDEVTVPGEMEKYGGGWTNANGEAVFIKTVNIPEHFLGMDLILNLGVIDDYDKTWFNGELVGELKDDFEEFWGYRRKYTIPAKLVKKGENVISIRLFDRYGKGGLLGSEDEMRIYPVTEKTGQDYYHHDYRNDFKLGDDPFRYFRW